jgi:23S rRNA (guanosine2251-2'-O)-methyltransferase
MENFPFSQKRFATLPQARRHKWIAIWLQKNYEELLKRRFNEKSLERFFDKYLSVRSWIDEPISSIKKPRSYRKWLEFTSEHFHEHRKKSGKGLAEANFLPKVITGDRQPDGPWNPCLRYRVAIDHMRSAFNVGSIIRVVDAVGFESVMLSAGTPGKETWQVQKTAMGCAGWIPQTRHKNLVEALTRVKEEGYSVIGIETVADSFGYAEYPWPGKGVVVLGNEEYGLTEDITKACDDFVHLPMSGFKNSVNVANAFAVIAFHISDIKNWK